MRIPCRQRRWRGRPNRTICTGCIRSLLWVESVRRVPGIFHGKSSAVWDQWGYQLVERNSWLTARIHAFGP